MRNGKDMRKEIIIYTSEIDVKTLQWNKSAQKIEVYEDDPQFDFMEDEETEEEFAEYNSDGFECLYAESYKSQETADKLVLDKALELKNIFQSILDKYKNVIQNDGATNLSQGTT